MKTRRYGLVVGVLAAVAGCGQKAERVSEEGGESGVFFNGKDLTGWRGLKEYWSVRDGALVGASPEGARFDTFLCSRRKYRDFELKFRVKLTGRGWTGNSGVNIRSEVFDPKKLSVKGPSCDMGQYYWGCLYGEHMDEGMMKQADPQLAKKVLKENEFNDYSIKCVGKHVTIQLNGATTVDDNFRSMAAEGIIAWQLHAGAPMEVIFKDIEFQELGR